MEFLGPHFLPSEFELGLNNLEDFQEFKEQARFVSKVYSFKQEITDSFSQILFMA